MTRDEYAAQLRERETLGVEGMIRGADIATIGDDTAFRHEVRAILDAYDVVMDERLARATRDLVFIPRPDGTGAAMAADDIRALVGYVEQRDA